MVTRKPIVGITMGDPSGIGPEIVAKALSRSEVYKACRPLVVGDAGAMEQGVKIAGVDLKVGSIRSVGEARHIFGVMDVLDLSNVDLGGLRHGEVSPTAGRAAFEAITRAIDLALDRKIDAIVTAPINKEALNAAGHHFPGHTEIFAHFTNTRDYAMLLAHGNLRVIHVSTHVSLRQACDLVNKERVLTVIRLANDVCKRLGIRHPKIGVAGLNPHSGEGGLFGDEEAAEIIPALEQARKLGILAEGPVPPDTLFPKASAGLYDACVAMYHDQGHIPFKLLGFVWDDKESEWQSVSGVNVTLGLPIVRVSVDHGTAFDRAGKGIANPDSLIQAIMYASKLVGDKP